MYISSKKAFLDIQDKEGVDDMGSTKKQRSPPQDGGG